MCSLGLFVLALIDNNPAQLSLMTALSATILFFDSKGRHILGWAFVLIICVFSQWGIGQFILQQDLGLRLWLWTLRACQYIWWNLFVSFDCGGAFTHIFPQHIN